MALTEEEIVARIQTLDPDATVDLAGEECSFEVYVISNSFAGQGLLQRQKAVLALFADDIKSGAVHALSVTAKTPDEFATRPQGLVQIQM